MQGGHARRDAQREHAWKRLPFREIAGSNVLILGFGAIGQACGKRLRALGASVTGVRRREGSSEAADQMISPSEVSSVLPNSDIAILCLPLTDETENTADAGFLKAMKPGSVLINVGRGALVDEAALLAALDNGKPERAYLDVVREEPLSSDSPIWSHPQITLTPHISALTEGSKVRTDKIFLQNLEQFLKGGHLRNLVSTETFA